jgi:prophage antirepressor-like protein
MTPNLTQLFEGKEIRVIEQDNDFWFPLVDLATAWGLNPNTLYQLIARNGRVSGTASG